MASAGSSDRRHNRDSSSHSGSASSPTRGHKRRRQRVSYDYGASASGSSGVFSGVSNSVVNKDMEYLCPICFEIFREAHVTKCGHTFCFDCIRKCLGQSARCPKCNFPLEGAGPGGATAPEYSGIIFPNFALNELVAKHLRRTREGPSDRDGARAWPTEIKKWIGSGSSGLLGIRDIDVMMKLLADKRSQMEAESYASQQTLLAEFLQRLKKLKEEELTQLKRETAVIQEDLDRVLSNLEELPLDIPQVDIPEQPDSVETASVAGPSGPQESVVPSSSSSPATRIATEGFNASFGDGPSRFRASLAQRRRRLHGHFDDLTERYFSARARQMAFPSLEEPPAGNSEGNFSDGLSSFADCLSMFTRYSRLRPLATLSYTADMFNSASIVSSIEFDADVEHFAIAGVTKRIKVYDYDVVLKDVVDIHYPSVEMVCGSKISCVTWNTFRKSTLASSDYDCNVIVWDSSTAQRVRTYQEHEKRCWSVDFNSVDTKLLASGSDDSRVKLWSTNMNHSIASLEANANVCCVKFNPTSCYHLAFGSADHCVHYYDLRNPKTALNIFRGHKKAVSYVKFLNATDLVSASTDSQLKLWSVGEKNPIRSFTGHVNEKNFVGLATDSNYITCGSENNGLYVYYRGLSKPLFNFKFDTVRSLLERDRREEEASNEFVSAVCWRQNSPVILAANSQGTIKVLELV